MKINSITLSDLRRMNEKEGLILQGCGGETQEWVDGINEMLTDKGILLDNTKFENVSVFKSDGVTCIFYPFENVHLDIGSWQCGGCSHIQPLQECGCPTMWTTGSEVLNLSRTKWKRSNPTVH